MIRQQIVIYSKSEYVVIIVYLVVTLRQLERQLERQKEKSDTELTAVHVVHKEEVEKLTKQLQTLQTDNNLLMVCCLQLATWWLQTSLSCPLNYINVQHVTLTC